MAESRPFVNPSAPDLVHEALTDETVEEKVSQCLLEIWSRRVKIVGGYTKRPSLLGCPGLKDR